MTTQKLPVKGIAIRSGVSRNKMKYLPQELKLFTQTLADKPIMKDHLGTVDSTVGLVTHSQTLDEGETVQFVGWTKADDVNEKIQDGRIKEVSIGAIASKVVKESEDSEELIPRGMTAIELSLTPIPGVIGTSITQALTENFNEFKKIQQLIKENKKEEKMEKLPTSSLERIERLPTSSLPTPIYINVGTTNTNEMVHCPECEKEFETKSELKKHKEEEHMEEEKLQPNLKEVEKALNELKEMRLIVLKEKYSLLCEKKGVKPVEANTEEELNALIKVTEKIELPKNKEEPIFQSRVPEQPSIEKVEEMYKGFVFESSSFGGGTAFYRESFDNPILTPPSESRKYKPKIKSE